MKTIFALLLGIFATSAIAGQDGIRLQAGFGDCRFTGSPPGQWWQPDHDHSNDFKDHCGEARVSVPVAYGFRAYAGMVTLGRAHTRAIAQTYPADNKALADLTLDPNRAECAEQFRNNCNYYWTGDGGPTPGFALGFSRELFRFGRLSVEPEVGVFIHQLKWNNQVYPLGCPDTECGWRITINQKSGYQFAPVIGVTATFEIMRKLDLYVAFREYLRIGEHVNVTAGVKGPVEQWLAGVQLTF
jgi:hypothetical protein